MKVSKKSWAMKILLMIIIVMTWASGCQKKEEHLFTLYDGTRYITSRIESLRFEIEISIWSGKVENINFTDKNSCNIPAQVASILEKFSPVIIQKNFTPLELEKNFGSVVTTSVPTGSMSLVNENAVIYIKYYNYDNIWKLIISDRDISVIYIGNDAQEIVSEISKCLSLTM